jgi:hypothetical protein
MLYSHAIKLRFMIAGGFFTFHSVIKSFFYSITQGWYSGTRQNQRSFPMHSSLSALHNASNVSIYVKVSKPESFFIPREGLYFTPADFVSKDSHCDSEKMTLFARLVDATRPLGRLSKPILFGTVDTTVSLRAAQLLPQLPKKHIFRDISKGFGLLATLMEGQWTGGNGHLLVDGNANVLRVKLLEK